MQYRRAAGFICVGALLLLIGCGSSSLYDEQPVSQTAPPKVIPFPTTPLATGPVTYSSRSWVIKGKRFRVKVVTAPLGSVRIQVGLAYQRVGRSAPLSVIAQDYRAIAGINGCFFDPNTLRLTQNPDHTLLTNGRLVHLGGRRGTTFWYARTGQCRIGEPPLKIAGKIENADAWRDSWYAYWMNRQPSDTALDAAVVYTSDWANTVTPAVGINIVVRHDTVRAITRQPQPIPRDGYVIYFQGHDQAQASRFEVGRRCSYRVTSARSSVCLPEGEVQEAIACGPTLLQDGKLVVDPVREGFTSPKILTGAHLRSAVGLTPDGRLLLVTCSSATMTELAGVMKRLGCTSAMNLDGGGSTALWYRGKYLTGPGRKISNALLILPQS